MFKFAGNIARFVRYVVSLHRVASYASNATRQSYDLCPSQRLILLFASLCELSERKVLDLVVHCVHYLVRPLCRVVRYTYECVELLINIICVSFIAYTF